MPDIIRKICSPYWPESKGRQMTLHDPAALAERLARAGFERMARDGVQGLEQLKDAIYRELLVVNAEPWQKAKEAMSKPDFWAMLPETPMKVHSGKLDEVAWVERPAAAEKYVLDTNEVNKALEQMERRNHARHEGAADTQVASLALSVAGAFALRHMDAEVHRAQWEDAVKAFLAQPQNNPMEATVRCMREAFFREPSQTWGAITIEVKKAWIDAGWHLWNAVYNPRPGIPPQVHPEKVRNPRPRARHGDWNLF
jgi:hypothetical protein